MNARALKHLLPAALLGAAAVPAASAITPGRPSTPAASAAARDEPNTHNMMLVGENTAFLSHLPMFDSLDAANGVYVTPHRFQVIMQVTFTKNGRDVTPLYLNDRKRNARVKMYTLNPALFVLSDLFPGGSRPALARFTANRVFRGHLERPGKQRIPALDGVTVNVVRVIRATTFNPAAQRPPALTYLLFGKGNDLFLAHTITRPPDFDQILAIHVPGHTFTDAELARGVMVTFPGRPDDAGRRIREDSTATGEFRVAGAGQAMTLQIHAARELYFEEGELLIPARFDPTPEEAAAGF